MKYEEYEALIKKTQEEGADKAPANLAAILDAIKADDAQRVKDAETIATQEKRITDLQKANSDLFLRSTGNQGANSEEEEEEKSPREIFNELFDARYYPKKEDET